MIGQLITSFLLGKVNPITTSTTCSHCAGPATDASRTRSYSESPGETRSSSKWLRAYKPSLATRIKAEAYYYRRMYHSHWKYTLRRLLTKVK